MKKCINCGAEMASDAEFCPECGGVVSEEKKISPRKVLNRVASGKLVLFIAILLTVGFIISVASAFLIPLTPSINIDDFNDIIDSSGDFLSQYGIDVSQINTDEIIQQADAASDASVAISRSITIIINIAPLLIAIAFWCIYISAKRGKVRSAGFTILQVLQILVLIVLIIVSILMIAGAVFVLGQLKTTVIPGLTGLVAGFFAFVIAMLVIAVVVRILTIRTIKSFKVIIKEKYYNEHISAVAAAALIISAGSSISSSLLLLATAFVLGPAMILQGIGVLCTTIAPILCGIAIFKCRFLLED